MTRTKQDFELWGGDDRQIAIAVTIGTSTSPYDMSGMTAKWGMFSLDTGASLIVKSTGGSGITISTSTITVTLDGDDTSTMSGMYYHEAQVVDGASLVSTVLSGMVKINPNRLLP